MDSQAEKASVSTHTPSECSNSITPKEHKHAKKPRDIVMRAYSQSKEDFNELYKLLSTDFPPRNSAD